MDPSVVGDGTDVVHELWRRHFWIPKPKEAKMQAGFEHLKYYPVNYYSFIFAECIARSVWEEYFSDDPFSGKAKQAIRCVLLMVS